MISRADSRHCRFCAAIAVVAASLVCPVDVRADGTESLGAPAVAIASGTGVAAAGVGLAESQPGTIQINVPSGARVEQVLAYWTCQYRISGDPEIEVDSTPVTGASIGGPAVFFDIEGVPVYSETYRADITGLGLITSGPNSVPIGGLACGGAFENSGAGILVIYSMASAPPAVIDVRDGQDLAFCAFEDPLTTTVEQEFVFAPTDADRTAKLWLLVASVHSLSGGQRRANRIKVTVDGAESYVNDALSSSDGTAWDTLGLDVLVPAGASSVKVQVLSEDATDLLQGGSGCPADPRPASLNWLAAGLSVPTGPAVGTCTQGYWKNHPGQWSASTLVLGDERYNQAELENLLATPPRGDASLILAHQLIAAKLNVAAGADAASIASVIAQADALLAQYPLPYGGSGKLPYGVTPRRRDPRRPAMIDLAAKLDEYNNEGPCEAGAGDGPAAPPPSGEADGGESAAPGRSGGRGRGRGGAIGRERRSGSTPFAATAAKGGRS